MWSIAKFASCIGLALLLAGCAATGLNANGWQATDLSPINVNSDRAQVENILGTPVKETIAGPYTIADYLYDTGIAPGHSAGMFGLEVASMGILTPLTLSKVLYDIEKQKRKFRVAYNQRNRVVRADKIHSNDEVKWVWVEAQDPSMTTEALAESGDPNYQLVMYQKTKDRNWLCAATNQGHAAAQFELGRLYDGGGLYITGVEWIVPRDEVQAYAWYKRAHLNGMDEADDAMETVSVHMTEREIADAAQLAAKPASMKCVLN